MTHPTHAELDSKGVPILPGDLLRSDHFIGERRKKHYLYHVAVNRDGSMYAVPCCHLEPTLSRSGGECLIRYLGDTKTVIHGFPLPEDRKKAKHD